MKGEIAFASRLAQATAIALERAREVDAEAKFPSAAVEALRDTGLMSLLVAGPDGGLGGDLFDYALAAESLGGACMATALIWTMHCQQVDAVSRHAAAPVRSQILAAVVGGLYIGSITTDDTTGGSLYSASSPLKHDGSSNRIYLDRYAPVVTGGRHAGAFLIKVRDSEDAGSRETSLVYVPRDKMDVTFEGDWDMLGMRGVENVRMRVRAEIDRSCIVGTRGGFGQIATDSFGPLAHIGWSASWLGCARNAWARTVRFMRANASHKLKDPAHRETMADIRLRLETVSAMLRTCIQEVQELREQGQPVSGAATQIRLNALKLVASRDCRAALDEMVDLVGLGVGYSRDSALFLERAVRDLRAASLLYSDHRLWQSSGALTVMDPEVRLSSLRIPRSTESIEATAREAIDG